MIDINEIYHNCMRVDLGNSLTLWFSYKTVVAFRVNSNLVVHTNDWSRTTGKHLNMINNDKSIRVNHDEFQEKWDTLVEPIFEQLQINTIAGGMFQGVAVLRENSHRRRAIGKMKTL